MEQISKRAIKRIGVVSDTHGSLPDSVFLLFNGEWDESKLRESVREQVQYIYDPSGELEMGFVEPPRHVSTQKCDLILHIGDIGPQMVLDELGAIARTVAVLGNNDPDMYWCSDGAVQMFRMLTFEGMDIAMAHIPTDLRTMLRRISENASNDHNENYSESKSKPLLAIHGHTHVPEIRQEGNRLVLCPGSPTRARRGSGHNVALIDMDGEGSGVVSIVGLLRDWE